jgi:hypothetical protein
MNRCFADATHLSPARIECLIEHAHRERARAMSAGFTRLWKSLAPDFHFHPGQWMERLG